MKRIFIDTNVILDVLLQREGFWQDSLRVLQLAELGNVKAYVSASSMTDIFYVVKKKLSMDAARQAIEGLLKLFDVVGVDAADLTGALMVPIDDFEDALQAYCAGKMNAEVIISRDTYGFIGIDIATQTPAEYFN